MVWRNGHYKSGKIFHLVSISTGQLQFMKHNLRKVIIYGLNVQELERLEMERIEIIRKHLCQYTTLRHETDMFNQSVSLILIYIWSCTIQFICYVSVWKLMSEPQG